MLQNSRNIVRNWCLCFWLCMRECVGEQVILKEQEQFNERYFPHEISSSIQKAKCDAISTGL